MKSRSEPVAHLRQQLSNVAAIRRVLSLLHLQAIQANSRACLTGITNHLTLCNLERSERTWDFHSRAPSDCWAREPSPVISLSAHLELKCMNCKSYRQQNTRTKKSIQTSMRNAPAEASLKWCPLDSSNAQNKQLHQPITVHPTCLTPWGWIQQHLPTSMDRRESVYQLIPTRIQPKWPHLANATSFPATSCILLSQLHIFSLLRNGPPYSNTSPHLQAHCPWFFKYFWKIPSTRTSLVLTQCILVNPICPFTRRYWSSSLWSSLDESFQTSIML